MIEQESFKVVIETKLYGQEDINQIKNHWQAFGNENKQIFLLINKEKVPHTYHQEIINELNDFNDTYDKEIIFASITFKEICSFFKEILQEYDLEMRALIDDYEAFCRESNLLDNFDTKIRVVLTGKTLQKNLEYRLYFHPRDRGYQNTRYLGLYQNKSIRAIGEVCCVVDVEYDERNDEFLLFDIIEGQPTENLEDNIRKLTLEAKEKYGYPEDEPRRFFVVKQYVKTNYKKASKGGLMGSRYIDLIDIEGYKEDMDLQDIANLLDGKEWNI
ncbi:hypothetical protein [Ornithinibacillus halophilus]|uniref:Uncharacterized protein n=1 Tax=Ornithinibacillus halophilus TaxID=930117 RepID=A0A1M5JC84_9BACI|nr:hypothetical protein [Ornithinibacillus halophilus]SHG37593.1 hypothetical protein SAMN05216225_102913 [Ornithinibacillus halophilus]